MENQTNQKRTRLLANLMLVGVGLIWGGGFVVMKNALDTMPVNFILALRFTVAALGLSYVLFLKKNRLSPKLILHGAILGALQYAAFATQTYGLMLTTAGKSALITACYIVLVPFMLWAWRKTRPRLSIFIAAFVCFIGIGLLTFDGSGAVNTGDALTLLCGVLFGVHIVFVDKYMEVHDMMLLTFVQFVFAALFGWGLATGFETIPKALPQGSFAALFYLCVLDTLVALTLQNVGIKYGSPEYASLFMSTESPFGAIFGVIFLHEVMSGRMVTGLVLVVLSLVLTQLDFKALLLKMKNTPPPVEAGAED